MATPKILLTGPPGIGKTTVIKRLASSLGERARGFYTEEQREGGKRVGFVAVTLRGRRAVLAHIGFPSPLKVGKYHVNPQGLDEALEELEEALVEGGKILLVDEIGKMELLIPRFREVIERVLSSPWPVVATVPAKPVPYTDEVKKRPGFTLIEVNRDNRDLLPSKLLNLLVVPPELEKQGR
ncbi:NTPase [Ammonifex thiophilus]|nr:NTPase [Ammonifex thiophilus]